MRHLVACERSHCAQRAGLVGDKIFNLAGAEARHRLASETGQIVIAGMCANADAARAGLCRNPSHGAGIAGMKSTSDVDAGGHAQHGLVVSHAFADVGVDVDLHRHAVFRILSGRDCSSAWNARASCWAAATSIATKRSVCRGRVCAKRPRSAEMMVAILG